MKYAMKYIMIAAVFFAIFGFSTTGIKYVETVGSQMVAQNATQQFNENVNAYANIGLDTATVNLITFGIKFISFLVYVLLVTILYKFVRSDYKYFSKGGKDEKI